MYIQRKNVQNFDPSLVLIMQTYALKDHFPYACMLILINTTHLILTCSCFVLPSEMKQIADGPTTSFTFTDMYLTLWTLPLTTIIDSEVQYVCKKHYFTQSRKWKQKKKRERNRISITNDLALLLFDSVPSAFQHLRRIWLWSPFANDQNLSDVYLIWRENELLRIN